MSPSRTVTTSLPDEVDPGNEAATEVGERLARVRGASGLTLATVANRSGMSPGFLSQIESGTANPTIATLAKVAAALGCTLGQLFGDTGGQPVEQVFAPRFAALPTAARGTEEVGVWDLTAAGSSRLVARLVRGAASDHIRPVSHPGEEFVCVLAGSCRISVGGLVHELGTHDACHFAASDVHQVSDGSDDLLLVIVVTEP